MTKILLVEDDKSLREIYGVRLLAEGYDIVSAGDGEEALAMAIKERPGLIVSDVMMPKISGFDMLDILRSTTETKNIKVIMMTALSSEDQRLRGEQLGADRYLVKSQVGIEDVVRTVHDVLGDTPSTAASPQQTFGTPAPSAVPRTSTPVPDTRPAASQTPQPAPSPTAPNPAPASVTAPAPPTEAPAAPSPTPAQQPAAYSPSPAPAAPQQAPSFAPSTPEPDTSSSLPQPTAPFSTNRPAGLGDRIIHPIEVPAAPVDIANLMDQELSRVDTPAPSTAEPLAPQQPSPVAPEHDFSTTPSATAQPSPAPSSDTTQQPFAAPSPSEQQQ